jgi:hypothetical protein
MSRSGAKATRALMAEFFAQIPRDHMRRLGAHYSGDFRLFEYPWPGPGLDNLTGPLEPPQAATQNPPIGRH